MSKKFVSNKDETVRMFNNDIMETLSRVHPSVPLIIFVPVVVFMIYLSIFRYNLSYTSIVGLGLFGIFIWTITEYLLHRYIFHWELKSELGKKIHFIFHGVHHDYPSDSRRLVMPPSVSIPLAALFYFLFRALIGVDFVYPFFAGFLIGYLFYDMTHYAVHHFNMKSKFWLAIKHHHIKHHFKDPDRGFGVSSPLWDILFKTNYPENEEQQA
jgi:4-hydroxysphinganine ceramide fatty acyl 2-hydroxylase